MQVGLDERVGICRGLWIIGVFVQGLKQLAGPCSLGGCSLVPHFMQRGEPVQVARH